MKKVFKVNLNDPQEVDTVGISEHEEAEIEKEFNKSCFYTVKELAETLHCSESTIKRFVKMGKIKPMKTMCRKLLFSEETLQSLFKAGEPATEPELQLSEM